jgi:hypothetical protein
VDSGQYVVDAPELQKLQNDSFSKLFVRISGGGSARVSSLAHSGEGGGSSPEMSQTLQSSKKLQNECFSKLFIRVSRGVDRLEH